MKIGIFGGTFDPPHKGHTLLVKMVCKSLGLTSCIIIPTYLPPHKQSVGGASAQQRLEMAALCDWGCPVQVSELELARGGKSYTIDTLVALRQRYPQGEFCFLLGSDMLLYFKKWHQWQALLPLATWCVASRNGQDTTQIEQMAQELRTLGGKVEVFHFDPVCISSTALRKKLAEEGEASAYLDQAVAAYIKKEGLYR